MYCKVIVTLPLKKEFIYLYPKKLNIRKGNLILVPFGQRKEQIGLVSEIISEIKINSKIKNLKEVIRTFNSITLSTSMMSFIEWVSNYTLYPKGLIFKMVIGNKEILDYQSKKSFDNKKIKYQINNLIKLNKEQKNAFKTINEYLKNKQKTIVLEGVTGSGKTEVFFEAIKKIIKTNSQTLILLPEISLTPQIEKRFSEYFGIVPDIWHSKINLSKKKKIWHRCYSGESKIIIGARSSLFLPFKRLKLIIVDEEHDISYKQEEGVRYHARDLAVVRSFFEKIPIILSTATPSIETYNNILKNKYEHVYLSKQYSGFDLPEINLINLKKEKLDKDEWISDKIIIEMTKCLERKEQILLFLNRRGYAPFTICGSCGYKYNCQNCSSWLVSHQKSKFLSCHHCGFKIYIKNNCTSCGAQESLKFIGPGIERVAEIARKKFPKTKIEIMSSDNMNTPNKIKKIIDRVENKEIDILVGTQILAKGYHFPNLSLVGILDADAGLMGGDLRASEHTYNLLQQVSGRAGRSKKVGTVFLQTYFEDNQIIQSLKQRNRVNFLNQTLSEREKFQLPPYGSLIAIIISGPNKSKLEVFTKKITKIRFPEKSPIILGPVEAPLFLLRGKYRYRLLLKGQDRKELNNFASKLVKNIEIPRGIRITIDVDPYSFV